MPSHIQDEDIWNKAKKVFKKQYNKEPQSDSDWASVTSIYKKMGGEFEPKLEQQAKEMLNDYSLRLDLMTETYSMTESMIPKFVLGFVKKYIKSPMTVGILSLIIWHFLQKHANKKELK